MLSFENSWRRGSRCRQTVLAVPSATSCHAGPYLKTSAPVFDDRGPSRNLKPIARWGSARARQTCSDMTVIRRGRQHKSSWQQDKGTRSVAERAKCRQLLHPPHNVPLLPLPSPACDASVMLSVSQLSALKYWTESNLFACFLHTRWQHWKYSRILPSEAACRSRASALGRSNGARESCPLQSICTLGRATTASDGGASGTLCCAL